MAALTMTPKVRTNSRSRSLDQRLSHIVTSIIVIFLCQFQLSCVASLSAAETTVRQVRVFGRTHNVTIHESPSLDSRMLSHIEPGDLHLVRESQAEWFRIRQGWVHSSTIVDLDGAVPYFTSELRKNPQAFFYVNRGRAHMEMMASKAAMADFDEAIKLSANCAAALIYRSMVLMEMGKCQKAKADIDKAVSVEPANWFAHLIRAKLLRQMNCDVEAAKELEVGLELNPKSSLGRCMRAALLLDKHEVDGAMEELNAVLVDDPQFLEAIYMRSILRTENGELEQAMNDIRCISKLSTASGHEEECRGWVHLKTGKFEDAAECASKAIQLNPYRTQPFRLRAESWEKLKQPKKAVEDWTTIIEKGEQESAHFIARGRNRMNAGQIAEAMTDFDHATELEPESYEGWYFKAFLFATTKASEVIKPQSAIEAAEKSCLLTDGKKWQCVGILGMVYAKNGEFDKALQYLSLARSIAPDPEKRRLQELEKKYMNRDAGEVK